MSRFNSFQGRSRVQYSFFGAVMFSALGLSAGCGSDKSPAGGASPTGFAIASSDYTSTSVALFDPATGTLTDDCVHTGEPALTQDLSGDVALPSANQATGELVVIDSGNSALTFVDPATCAPRVQQSVATNFDSNPHDVVVLSATKAYVTRFNTNSAPTADPSDFDEGDDILIIDPSVTDPAKSPVMGRIALAGYATTVPGATLQADPDRAVLAAGKVYVTLDSISPPSLTAATVFGPGRIVVIDPTTDTVTATIDLPNQKDCSGIQYSAINHSLYVSCGGSFSDADQIGESALVQIDISAATPVLTTVISGTALGGGPINFAYAALSGGTAFFGTLGSFADPTSGAPAAPDGFYGIPLAGGAPTLLGQGGAFNLGLAAADPVSKLVLLPDGDSVTPVVHVFDAAGATVVAAPTRDFAANPAGGLPPRIVALY